ncbi:MAG TPA: G1 family glutamic endopeptidase [Gemmataceae bacterium]|nr:G1 family glutamic endopeptidase [Gemmataceae bacterium]
MKTRDPLRRRPWVEELEPRVVLSAVPPLLYHAAPTISTTSTNWSGYAVESNFNAPATNSVTAVSGSWVVPSVSGTGTAYSSFWVGIDGFSSNTVEQIGTDSDLVNGVPVYYAWYEMYPNPSRSIALTINPGDTINASVIYSASTKAYTLSLTDATSGHSFATTQKVAGAKNNSAEWIAEAPSSNSGVLPLANFGTAQFTKASATINGSTGGIDNSAWQSALINMVANNGTAKATTSSLNSNGGFSVAWNNSGVQLQQHHHRSWFFSDNAPTADATSANVATQINTGSVSPAVTFVNTGPNASTAADSNRSVPVASSYSPALMPMTLIGVRAGTDFAIDALADDADAAFMVLPAREAATTGSFTEVMTPHRQPPIVSESLPNHAAPVDVNDAVNPLSEGVTPASDAGPVNEGNIVTRSFTKVLWLVGAVGLVAHAAFVSKSRAEERRQPQPRKI